MGKVNRMLGLRIWRAIEEHDAAMDYSVNGHGCRPFQYGSSMRALARVPGGVQMHTELSGPPLPMTERRPVGGAVPALRTPSARGTLP